MKRAREMTANECANRLLEHVRDMVLYAEREARWPTVREKLEGLAFSILVAIDGETSDLPAFRLIPHPHPDDAEYLKSEGRNWWPSDLDIAGGLHERFSMQKEKDSVEQG